jgi:cell division septation protein DedD
MSSAAAPPEPDTAAQPSSYVVTPAADTPATPQPAQQSLRFHVQVGIFNTQEDAQALVQRLQSLGYIATAAAGDVYRVWVGGYLDRETAERLAANLRKAGFDAALVP